MTTIAAAEIQRSGLRRSQLKFMRRIVAILCLALCDAMAFASGYYLFRRGHQMPAIMLSSSNPALNLDSAVDLYLIMGTLFILTRYILGDYVRRQLFWDSARATASTLALAAVPDGLFVLLLNNKHLYLPFAESWLFLVLAIPLYRQTARWLLRQIGVWQIPTAFLGSGPHACDAFQGLKNSLSLGFDVQYLVAGEEDGEISPKLAGLRCIKPHDPQSLVAELQDVGCNQVVIVADSARGPQVSEVIQRLIGANMDVVIIPTLRGLPVFGLSTHYLFGKDLLLIQVRNNLARIPSRAIKRLVDVVGPSILLVLLSPLLLAIALAIKLEDGGPICFMHWRIGRNGRPFRCMKFRTMAVDANERLDLWRKENPDLYAEFAKTFKLQEDPRITRTGRWLRKTSLDELPQLVNVLRGEMSLVGPRPVLEQELRDYYGPAARLYERVRPGITGLWQVSGRSNTTYAERVVYDEWYILNWSLWYDVVILIQTVWIVLARKGAV